MTDRPHTPLVAFPPVMPADGKLTYVDRLNGVPRGSLPSSRWYPLPVLDPDVAGNLARILAAPPTTWGRP